MRASSCTCLHAVTLCHQALPTLPTRLLLHWRAIQLQFVCKPLNVSWTSDVSAHELGIYDILAPVPRLIHSSSSLSFVAVHKL